ncbi:MAG: urease accessory UreF family protein [Synechococcaceae cyanobacterium]|nr:urease accessory UreF family protein [Synechococcaceae cyanobacterium]
MSADRLRLFQLVSPALPVGAFSYSEGLEVLAQSGHLDGLAAVETWLLAELERGLLPIEAATLPPMMAALRAWRAGQPGAEAVVRDLDGWLLAQREAAEMRAQHSQMGRSLLQLLADLGWPLPHRQAPAEASAEAVAGRGGDRPSLGWPAAWAWAGLCLELPPLEVLEAYLYGWSANQISAAVRLVPLGPTEAQRLQLALAPRLAARAAALAELDPRQLRTGGVGAGLAQLGHAALYSRLFRS